jgi:CBS domain containing-hemolysin-like protein
MSPWVWIVLTTLIAANALYVAAEFGAVGVRRSRVRRMSDDGHRLAQRLLPHVQDPAALDRYVGASQVGITLSSLMAGAYAQATFTLTLAPFFAATFALTDLTALSVAAVVVLLALTAVQLVLGELVPKALALQYPTQTALATVLPMEWSLVLFKPIISALNGAALLMLRAAGAAEHSHRHLHSPEEIDLLIAESRDGGFLEPEEQERLRRALHFGKRRVRDLMVPRERMTMVEVSAPWEETLRTVIASPFSRLPVFRGSVDHVVGTLRVKDLVERYAMQGTVRVERLMRPVVHLIEDLPADRALGVLRERRAHSAIVSDANGRTAGLITIQDLLGELLGAAAPSTAPRGNAAGGAPAASTTGASR